MLRLIFFLKIRIYIYVYTSQLSLFISLSLTLSFSLSLCVAIYLSVSPCRSVCLSVSLLVSLSLSLSPDSPLWSLNEGERATMDQRNYDLIWNDSVLDVNFTYNLNISAINNNLGYEIKLINFYLTGVSGMTVCCLGIIGNILSFVVLTRKTMKSSTYTYLSGLAICDLLVLFTTMLLILKDTKFPELGSLSWSDDYYHEMFPIVHPAALTFQVTSIWLTLAFTVDRYIMICHPFKAERMCDIPRARRVVLGLYLAGIAFNIPRCFEYTVIEIDLPNNETRSVNMLTKFGENKYFRVIVHSWLYLIFVCMIPFFTMAVLNAFLIHTVHQSRRKGKSINAKEKRRNDTTIMLIGVIIVFFICQMPALISRMMWAFNPTLLSNWRYHLLNEIGNFLVIFNSATNIIPYYFFGQRFRNEFWRSFCFCFMGKENVRRLARSMSLSFDRRFSNASTIVRGIELNGLSSNEVPQIQEGGGGGGGGNGGSLGAAGGVYGGANGDGGGGGGITEPQMPPLPPPSPPPPPRDGANGTALVLDQHKTRTVLLSNYHADTNLWTSLKQKLIPSTKQPATDMGVGGGCRGGVAGAGGAGSGGGGTSRLNRGRKPAYTFKNKSLTSLCLKPQKQDERSWMWKKLKTIMKRKKTKQKKDKNKTEEKTRKKLSWI